MLTVVDTNFEACKAKRSLVQLGYLKDDFIKFFTNEVSRKEILIHRGYWSRVYSIQNLVKSFLEKFKNEEVQIISIGSGFDTFIFNLLNEKKYDNFTFSEFDFEEVVLTKINIIKENEELNNLVNENLEIKENYLKSKIYNLISCDIRNLKNLESKIFDLLKLSKTKPTIVFSECVLIYLQEKEIYNYLEFLSNNFTKLIKIDYEMFNFNDSFGKTMINNFKNYGVPLMGYNFFNSFENIKNNYFKTIKNHFFEIKTMKEIYYNYINKDIVKSIEKLEWFDELEEFFLIQDHYFISISSNFNESINFNILN